MANTAQLFTITGRRRFDPMSVSRVTDFRLRDVQEIDATQAWQQQDLAWTPYCYDQASQRVALVGCLRESDLTEAPFFYQAQFQHAQRLLTLDSASLEQLVTVHQPRFQTPVMIYSTGRSGTTLVSRMFAQLASCVSLSEPDLHTNVLEAGLPNDAAVPILRAGAQLYFQPRHASATHLVLKFRGMCVELASVLRTAHPNVVEFFLYRDAEAYVTSSMRAFSYFGSPLWSVRWLHRLVVTRPILTKALQANYPTVCRFFPVAGEYTPAELTRLGPVGLLTISWLSMVDRARQAQLPALRYENFMRDPPAALRQLLNRCGLHDEEFALALRALDRDSQQGSVVGRQRTRRFELSARDRQTIRAVLARHSVIDRPDFELPLAIV